MVVLLAGCGAQDQIAPGPQKGPLGSVYDQAGFAQSFDDSLDTGRELSPYEREVVFAYGRPTDKGFKINKLCRKPAVQGLSDEIECYSYDITLENGVVVQIDRSLYGNDINNSQSFDGSATP